MPQNFALASLLQNITVASVEAYRRERLKHISPRTVNIEIHHCLFAMLKQAVRWGDLDPKHLPQLKKLKEQQGRLRFLSDGESKSLIDAAKMLSGDMEIYIYLMLYAGLRSGEALALRWKDIDFSNQILSIASRSDWKTKTMTNRNVPIPPDFCAYLARRKEVYLESEYVVAASGDYSSFRIKRLFINVVKQAGLPVDGEERVTAHTLRHTYASNLVMQGIPLYTIGKLLGHSDTKTTQIYAHLAQDYLKETVKKILFFP